MNVGEVEIAVRQAERESAQVTRPEQDQQPQEAVEQTERNPDPGKGEELNVRA